MSDRGSELVSKRTKGYSFSVSSLLFSRAHHQLICIASFAAHRLLTRNSNTVHRYLADGDPVPSLPSNKLGYMHTSDGLEVDKGIFVVAIVVVVVVFV